MIQDILSVLPGDHPWQNTLCYYETLPSTNDLAKQLAAEGAPQGTVVLSGQQTAGRGRLGRSFYAPAGLGLYFSLILRPNCLPQELMHLTCAAAVAACDAVEKAAGIRPQIKWTNDLVTKGKKLGGILTELSLDPKSGHVDWVVIGIGFNCCHSRVDFPPELQNMTTSLLQLTGCSVTPGVLAGHLIRSLSLTAQTLLTEKAQIMDTYKRDCMTVGQDVVLLRGDDRRYGKALDISQDGGLIVRFQDGSVETVESGEISVRGLYGYV